jgi:alpha-1,3-rhamnosyl/mannosyltransferase
LIPLRYPTDLTPSQLGRFRSWVEHLKQADQIIAVSHYTKTETQELLGLDGSNIHVVSNGIELSPPASSGAVEERLGFTGDRDSTFRIGSIGSTLKRKNLEILPRALADLKARTTRKIIVVRCGQLLPAELAEEIRRVLGADGLVELGHLSDADLHGFYRAVDAVVVPSFYEGFGLPLLEAMAQGVPVVSSNTTSMPEVGGDDVLYFDPHSPAELAERLAVVASRALSPDWLERARRRAISFTWRSSLEGIYQVYDSCFINKAGHPATE